MSGVSNPSDGVLALFEETGAYLRGHFRLTSGLHSGEYLQCAKVLRFPQYAERFGRALADTLRELAGGPIDLVVSPAMGGLIIGHEVARALGVPFLFSERDSASGRMTLRRGFVIEPGQSAVIIEDVITTGGSTREVLELLAEAGGKVLAAGSIIDRSGGEADVGVRHAALATLHPITWKPEGCPLCAQGVPVQKPGSRNVPAAG